LNEKKEQAMSYGELGCRRSRASAVMAAAMAALKLERRGPFTDGAGAVEACL
jgi:hypothetical protein